jgi:hypothetical protein
MKYFFAAVVAVYLACLAGCNFTNDLIDSIAHAGITATAQARTRATATLRAKMTAVAQAQVNATAT